jgi:hypothetical protein
MSVEKRSNVYHDDKLWLRLLLLLLALLSLPRKASERNNCAVDCGQQQQIEEIVATELITERPNGACRNENNKGL